MQTALSSHRATDAPTSAAIPGGDGGGRRYPFLPPSNLGWTPYVWLIYLAFFFIDPLLDDNRPWEHVACAAVLAVFLPFYFWGYWQHGKRALVAVFVIAGLGAVASPWNGGSSVFFIYAAGYLGAVGPPRVGARWLAVLVGWIVVEGWLFGLPAYWWIAALVFTLMVAGLNIHFSDVARRDAALRRTQEEVERLAKVAERERIGRDLHDLLGHTLSVIALKSELASKLADRDPARAVAEIREVERVSREALAEVRAAVQGYKSRGLTGELHHAQQALVSAGVRLDADVPPVLLSPRHETVLALTLRETITNVVRHARASVCRVVLAADGADLVLTIQDDGVGGPLREGNGLVGIRERVSAAGGTLDVDSRSGVRISVRIPMAGASA
jgi:two-component system sensor histidine kinase DesK